MPFIEKLANISATIAIAGSLVAIPALSVHQRMSVVGKVEAALGKGKMQQLDTLAQKLGSRPGYLASLNNVEFTSDGVMITIEQDPNSIGQPYAFPTFQCTDINYAESCVQIHT